jgi:drug/metabolite transporter (DMT)-like permease
VNPIVGITLKLLSTLSFTLMSALVKATSERYHVGEIVFFRSFFALVPLVIWLVWRGEFPSAIRTRAPLGHIKRGLIGTAGMTLGFIGLSLLPLSEAVAIGYAAPLLTVALAALLLGETVRLYRWSAVAIGLSGVLVMLAPHLGNSPSVGAMSGSALGAMAAFGGAICAAGAAIQTRRLTMTETTGAIVFYFMTLTSLVGLATFALGWNKPDLYDAGLLIMTGILGGIGQILMTQSFRYADASLIAPFEYSSMIWALLIGWLVFSHLPTTWVIVGAVIVASSGIFVIWRERKLGLERTKTAEAAADRAI